MQRGARRRIHSAPRGHAPYVNAPWLEEKVWADVRQFLRDPGAVLERVREEIESDDASAELEARHAALTDRLAVKDKERDRWLHLYAQGHLSDAELEMHLADLRVQLDNLKLLLDSAEDELEAQREHASVAETAETWLMTLRDSVEEIGEDSAEAYAKRRELVRLLVERIMVGRDENRRTSVRITYRFGPPKPPDEEDMFVNGVEYASRSLSANPGQPRGLAGRGRLSRSVAWPPRRRGRERGRAD
jgi:hypothetical protein